MKKITEPELASLLTAVSPTGVDFQGGRVLRLLATGEQRTGVICAKCSVGNISDLVLKQINPKVIPLGFFVGCIKPPTAIRNKFSQVAGDWIWQLHRAELAANDDEIGSSAQDWEAQLKPTLSSSE
jgi:hypothetical protein